MMSMTLPRANGTAMETALDTDNNNNATDIRYFSGAARENNLAISDLVVAVVRDFGTWGFDTSLDEDMFRTQQTGREALFGMYCRALIDEHLGVMDGVKNTEKVLVIKQFQGW